MTAALILLGLLTCLFIYVYFIEEDDEEAVDKRMLLVIHICLALYLTMMAIALRGETWHWYIEDETGILNE